MARSMAWDPAGSCGAPSIARSNSGRVANCRAEASRCSPEEVGYRGPPPNKRLKLAGPALRGGVRVCPGEALPQGGVLAPAGARPAAYARAVRQPRGHETPMNSNSACCVSLLEVLRPTLA